MPCLNLISATLVIGLLGAASALKPARAADVVSLPVGADGQPVEADLLQVTTSSTPDDEAPLSKKELKKRAKELAKAAKKAEKEEKEKSPAEARAIKNALIKKEQDVLAAGLMQTASSTKRAVSTAECFSGGGYKAMTSFAAVVASMIHVLSRKLGCDATTTELFANIDAFGSNSGGSWFSASIFYSQAFVDNTLIAMARDPANAGKIWNDEWTSKFVEYLRTGDEDIAWNTKGGQDKTKLFMLLDSIIESDTRLHEGMLEAGLPPRLISSFLGLALHGMRITGEVDADLHGVLQAVLLPRSPCPCEALALSHGLVPQILECSCAKYQGDAQALNDLTMSFTEGSITNPITANLQIAKSVTLFIWDLMRGSTETFRNALSLKLTTRADWLNYVSGIIVSGTGLSHFTLAGTPKVLPFAKNKLWVIACSMITPGGKDKGHSVSAMRTLRNSVTYTVKTRSHKHDFNLYTPTKISIVLGGGINQATTHPFCANADCFGFYNEYKSTTRIPFVTKRKSTEPLAPYFNMSVSDHAGLSLLTRVAATSSACLGILALVHTPQNFGHDWATWIAESIHPYDQARIVNARAEGRGDSKFHLTMRDYVHWNMVPLADGCFSDNTASVHVLSTGHDELIVHPAFGPVYLLKLFSNYLGLPKFADAAASEALAIGGLFDLPVFEMDAPKVYDMILNNFTYFEVAKEKSKTHRQYLDKLRFGTIETTTITNVWAGVEAGRQVKINVIENINHVDPALLESMWSFGYFIQQTVSTYTDPAHRAKAEAQLDAMYLRAGGRAPPTSCAA